MSIKFRPLSNYVVVKVEIKQKSKGGLYIPESAERPILSATVVAISNDTFPDTGLPMVRTVKVGDKILFNVRQAGEVIDVYGEQFAIMREGEIFGILEPNPDYEAEYVAVTIPKPENKSKIITPDFKPN